MKMKVGVVCQCEPEFDVRMGLVKAANVGLLAVSQLHTFLL